MIISILTLKIIIVNTSISAATGNCDTIVLRDPGVSWRARRQGQFSSQDAPCSDGPKDHLPYARGGSRFVGLPVWYPLNVVLRRMRTGAQDKSKG
jgi:hypothetical protein